MLLFLSSLGLIKDMFCWHDFHIHDLTGQSWDSYGVHFITVFPENIAFYYPRTPANALSITALFPDTNVEVFVSDVLTYTDTLPAGKPVTVTLPLDTKEYHLGYTYQTVRVSSTEFIVVQSISKKGDSVQTNVVQPMKNLGTLYTIPSLNYSQMLNTFYQSARNVSKRYSSFRLVIINAENMNNYVTIVKLPTNNTYILFPYEALQLQTDGTETAVYSDYRVAVMLTHPCVETENADATWCWTNFIPTLWRIADSSYPQYSTPATFGYMWRPQWKPTPMAGI